MAWIKFDLTEQDFWVSDPEFFVRELRFKLGNRDWFGEILIENFVFYRFGFESELCGMLPKELPASACYATNSDLIEWYFEVRSEEADARLEIFHTIIFDMEAVFEILSFSAPKFRPLTVQASE